MCVVQQRTWVWPSMMKPRNILCYALQPRICGDRHHDWSIRRTHGAAAQGSQRRRLRRIFRRAATEAKPPDDFIGDLSAIDAAHRRRRCARVAWHWIDRHKVTNAQFARFVDATGYVTLAEHGLSPTPIPGWIRRCWFRARLSYPANPTEEWRADRAVAVCCPARTGEREGPGSTTANKHNHPVVHRVRGRTRLRPVAGAPLPTEAQ